MVLPITPMKEKESCELCGSENAEMDFVHVSVVGGHSLSVEGKICNSCWAAYSDDEEIAFLLLKKRASNV